MKTEDGRAVLTRLLKDADVVIENYRRGTMEKMGFGYESLHALNPKLIFCSISASSGAQAPTPIAAASTSVAQGMSGLMSITGERQGTAPMKAGAPLTDIGAGILACVGISGCASRALNHRERTDGGHISV